jgi:hypothetical protein
MKKFHYLKAVYFKDKSELKMDTFGVFKPGRGLPVPLRFSANNLRAAEHYQMRCQATCDKVTCASTALTMGKETRHTGQPRSYFTDRKGKKYANK